jgi:hypothetical protein
MDDDVQAYLEGIPVPKRRGDAATVTELMKRAVIRDAYRWHAYVPHPRRQLMGARGTYQLPT